MVASGCYLNISGNELQMMVLKACRGVGIPVAQAQDVARAVATSPESLEALLLHLAQPLQEAYFDFSEGLKISKICLLRDFSICVDAIQSETVPVVIKSHLSDTLLVAMAALRGINVAATGADLVLSKGSAETPSFSKRSDVDLDDWTVLSNYAALTYVPETEASRLGGAGAGLTDND